VDAARGEGCGDALADAFDEFYRGGEFEHRDDANKMDQDGRSKGEKQIPPLRCGMTNR
jgi:hypothetical protein